MVADAVPSSAALVLMVKVASLVPPGIVTEVGTDALTGSLLARATTEPAGGAAPSSVTLPVTPAPAAAVAGVTVTVASAAGVTLSVTDWLVAPEVTVSTTAVGAATP